MALFRSKPSSPASAVSDLKGKIQDVKVKFLTARGELVDLPIPMMKETLIKIDDFLDLCKKSKGEQSPIDDVLNHLTSLLNDVLDPVLREKRHGEVEITEALLEQFQALFEELYSVIPIKPSSSWDRMFRSVDVGAVVTPIIPKIEAALQTFLTTGSIQCIGCSGQEGGIHKLDLSQTDQTDPDGPADADGSIHQESSPAADSDSDSLQPTAHGIMKRFRILLLGKSGVGKSSLVAGIFNVSPEHVSHYRAGIVDINTEFTSPENPHFILHDSMGYESGTLEQFQTIEEFIETRSKKAEISEQIHAIWLCAEIPIASGRIFEVGDESLLKKNLGKVPLIVVFTQYDRLVGQKESELDGLDDERLNRKARANAEKAFDLLCMEPLRKTCNQINRSDLPPVIKVSVQPSYEDTLSELTKLTEKLVTEATDISRATTSSRNRAPEPDSEMVGIAFSRAQRVDPGLKVNATIKIGKKKFWKCLGASLFFRDKALYRCSDTIHEDIVSVWNFYDPSGWLIDDEFKQRIRAIVSDLVDQNAGDRDPSSTLAKGLSGAAAITGLVGAVMPPGALIVGPITAVAALAVWALDVYKQTPGVVRCLMAYIVDLTLVMRLLFWKMRQLGGIQSLRKEVVYEVLQEFQDSSTKQKVHSEIRSFVSRGGVLERTNKDKVLDKVVALMEKYGTSPPGPTGR